MQLRIWLAMLIPLLISPARADLLIDIAQWARRFRTKPTRSDPAQKSTAEPGSGIGATASSP